MKAALQSPKAKPETIAITGNVIVDESTWSAIWFMTWPLFLNMAVLAVASFIDVWTAGKLGADVQAAVGLGGQVGFFVQLFSGALACAATAMISRRWGAGDSKGSKDAALAFLCFSVIGGILATMVGFATADLILQMQGASLSVLLFSKRFLFFYLLAQVPGYIHWVSNGTFRAIGKPGIPLAVMVVTTALIFGLEVGLCLSPWHCGIAGIGLAWLIAESVAALLSVIFLVRAFELDCAGYCLSVLRGVIFTGTLPGMSLKPYITSIFQIGLPACMRDFLWFGASASILMTLSLFANASAAQAAWTVAVRTEEIVAAMPLYALMLAAATIVGQNLGAGKASKATRAGWQLAGVGAVLNIVVACVLFTCADTIAGAISADATVANYAALFFKAVAISEPFVALWYILFGAMQGAGYTGVPMWATAAGLIFVRSLFAWYLGVSVQMGISGVWIAIAVSNIFMGICAVLLFRSSFWKEVRMLPSGD